MQQPDVSVLIVTWNAADSIEDCLSSIVTHTLRASYELILIDNGSVDGTTSIVSERFPLVRLVQTGANLGFAPAMNIALQLAKGRHVFFLNPDTRIIDDAIDRMVLFLDSHPDCGCVSPQILEPDGSINMFVCRQFPSLTNTLLRQFGLRKVFARHHWAGKEFLPAWNRTSESSVPCVCGAAMMIPRSVVFKLGLLDTTIPMYFEDLDYCKRITDSGFDLYYVPTAKVMHVGAESASKSPQRRLLLAMEIGEAPWLFLRQYSGKFHAAAFRVIVAIGSMSRLAGLSLLTLSGACRTSSLNVGKNMASSAALLRWAFTRRSSLYSRINAVFEPHAMNEHLPEPVGANNDR